MTLISLIAAIDEQHGLGKDNQLLCHLPADLKHFKDITMGKPIVMGRKTYQSIGKALPGRLNIVLSQHMSAIDNDVHVVSSLPDALALAATYPEVMIIGGAQLFEQALPHATRIYLTTIHATFSADVFFPKLDKNLWHCCETVFRPRDEKNHYDLTFTRYDRIA